MDEQLMIAKDRSTELKNEMLFMLSNRDSGTLALAVTASEKQTKELEAFLEQHMPEYQYFSLDLTPYSYTSLDKALTELLPDEIKSAGPAKWVINVIGLENNLSRTKEGRLEYTSLLPQLNFEREQLFRQPQIIILWVSKDFFIELRSKAPDLMHWLSNRFIFGSDSASLEDAEETYNKGEIKNPGKIAERTDRIIELEAIWEKLCLDHQDKERLVKDKINISLSLGKEYCKAFDFTHSEFALKRALILCEKTQSAVIADVHFELGNTYLKFHKQEKALIHYQESLKFDKALNNQNALGADYHQIGRVYEEQHKFQEALNSYNNAITSNTKTGNEFHLGNSYHQIGSVYERQRKWQEALDNYDKAVQWKIKGRNEFELGSTYHQIGMVYEEQNRWQDALNNYYISIEWKTKTNNEFELGSTYHQIGMVYEEQHKWQEALDNYNKAISWYFKTGNDFDVGSAYHQIGMVYEKQGRWHEALSNYETSITWNKKTNNKIELGSTYHQIGRTYEEQKKWQEALYNYHEALKWKSKMGKEFQMGGTYHQIGRVYEEQGLVDKALEHFLLAEANLLKFSHPNPVIAIQSVERVQRLLSSSKLE